MSAVARQELISSDPSSRVKARMLSQMAEALEDEVAGLFKRVASFEEEEFLLGREIGDRETEINRLALKLASLRGERDGLLEKIESLSQEAAQLREEVCNSEEEIAIDTLDIATRCA